MIINYNSLSRGRDAWLKNDVGDVFGSPPMNSGTVSKKSWLMSMLLLCCLLAGGHAWAQANAYSFSSTTGNSLTVIPSPIVTTTVTTGSADDGTNLVSPSGFTFPYNGSNYTQFLMTTNGWLKMGNVAPSGTIASSLTSVVADGVYAFGRDGNLNVANGGSLTHGATADGKYVFQIVKLSGGGSGSASATIYSTSQIVLWGSTSATPGKIEIIYGASAGTPLTGGAIGISDTAGRYTNAVTGTTTATTTASTWPASGVMYTFLPPPPCSGTPSAATVAPIAQQVCTGSTPSTLTATGFTTGATGLTFQWQQSTDNGATWTNTTTGTGGTTATYTPAGFAGTTIQYRLSQICAGSGLTGYSSVATVSPPASPTTQASALTTTLGLTGFTASWTNGSGNRRLVIVSTSAITDPTNGSGPAITAAAAYTSGQQIVYDGTGTSVSVTGLTCNTTYFVKVYEYQRCGTSAPYSYFYNVTSGTNAATVVPGIVLTALPMVNAFTGFTGANLSTVFPGWYEGKGTAQNLNPAGTVSDWTNATLGGFTTAKVNLFGTAKNEFIISPKAPITANSRITFKAAITNYNSTAVDPERMVGTDDKVNVLISTDGCGAAWTVLYTFNAANTTTLTNVLTDYIVDIPASYIGQTVQIAFQANDGPIDNAPDYDFHITAVKVELTPSCSAVTGLNASSVAATTADIAWTAPTTAPAGGYDYELRTSGAVQSGATGLIYSGNETGLLHSFTGLTGLTSYTAYVRSHCGSGDTSTWNSVAFTTLVANDICANATTVACGSTTAASLVGSTNESQAVCGISGVTTQNSAGIWYKIVGNGNDVTVSTASSATNVDTRLAVFSGACGTLTCIGGSDDISTDNLRSEVLFNAAVGTEYYILLYSFSTTTPTAAITLTVNCTAPCTPATTNDVCSTAATVTVGTPLITNNTCSAPSSVTYPSCGSSFGTYFDTWYTFNSGTNTTLAVSTTAVTTAVVGFAVYSGTCAGTLTQIACNTTGVVTNVTLTANTTYFVRAFSASTVDRGDFTLRVKVPCLNATGVSLGAVSATSATFNWTAPATVPGNGYEYEIRTTGAAGSGATGLAASGSTTSLTATVNTLTASTSYNFYIRTSCAVGDYSPWSAATTFLTPCVAVSAFPWVETFEADSPTVNCLRVIDGDGDSDAWDLYEGYARTGLASAGIYTDFNSANNDYLITPQFSLGATPKRLTFWARARSASEPEEISIKVSTTGSGLANFSNLVLPSTPIASTTYVKYTVNLDAFANNNIYIAFVRENAPADGYYLYVDDVTVENIPTSIVSFTPTTVCENDNETVTISGFDLSGVTAVTFNGVAAQSFTVVNGTTITAVPARGVTAGYISVSTPTVTADSPTQLAVNPSPVVEDITGPNTACVGDGTITLSTETPSGLGTWASSNPSVATVTSSGVVTPVAQGTAVISFEISSLGCTTTKTHEVTISEPIVIVSSTPTQTTTINGSAAFTVNATGTGTPNLSYQWQISTDEGATFTDVTNGGTFSGATTNTLTLTNIPAELNISLYQLVITGACGTVTTDVAVLIVGETGIVTNPQPVVLCASGSGIATFTVEGSPDVTDYEWQEDIGGDQWQTLSDNAIYSGTDTATLTITGVTAAYNTYRYRVILTGNGTAESNPVSLSVSESPTVSLQPADQTVCFSGASTAFSITATGAASYQWQHYNGSTWSNVAAGTPSGATYSGATSNTLTVTTTAATSATGNHLYRVVLGGIAPCDAVPSEEAELFFETPTITAQPAPATVFAGNATTFTAAASTGPVTTYQWQYSTLPGSGFANVANNVPVGVTYSGADSATLTVTTTSLAAASSARYYRLVATSGTSCAVNSNAAQLTIGNYCTPTAATSGASYFNNFATTGGATNITNNASGFTAGGYGNFSNLSASQLRGQTFNFTTALVGTTVGVSMWIDWNQNQAFEADERVYTSAGYVSTASGTITVPATALGGTTRMRVLLDFNTSTPANPCGPFSGGRGEVEDYSFTVLLPPPCVTPVAGTIAATTTNVCVSGAATLTATGYTTGQTGITFQWYNSAGPIAGQTGFTYTTPVLTAPESYFFRATCANGNVTADSNTIEIAVSNPSLVSTTPGTRCGTGTVNLSATGSAGTTVTWYAAASGGSPLATTPTFTTPVIAATTNYYAVAEVVGNGRLTLGAGLNTSSSDPISFANGGYGGMKGQYLITAAELYAAGLRAGNINSFGFDVTTAGAAMQGFTVQMGNTALTTFGTASNIVGGLSTVFNSATVTPVTGINTLTLNTPFAWDGTSNIIVSTSWSNVNSSNTSTTLRVDPTSYVSSQSYRKDNETAANMLAFTGSTAGSGTFAVSSNRPKFILGSTNAVTCSSSRTLVAATVTSPPTLTLSAATAAMCVGGSATVSLTSPVANFDTYVWTPAVSGSAATGFTFSPSVTTTYNLLATNASGCTNTATVVVTVNPLPTAVTITPATPSVCLGESVALTANGGMTSSQITSGVGTSTSTASSTIAALGPNPLQNYYGGTKQQWIYRASELTALGFGSGSKIYSIALNLAAANTTPLAGLTVKMKNSATQSFATATAWETGMTEVISQVSHTPVVGLNTFTLSTPFVWDGTSSLVVEMNYSNNNGGAGATNTARFSATTYTSTIFYRADNVTAANMNTYSGSASYTYSSRNDIVFVADRTQPVTWTPTTDLYTDAAATTPYTGGNARVVYAKPAQAATYSAAVVTTEGCPGTAGSVTVTINTPTVWYVDADNDNYGNSALPTVLACVKPALYAAVGGDCNDANADVNPGVAEIFYNGIDDNCDGNIDEGRQLTTAILANRCGTKLSKIYQSVNCDFRIANITGYRFRVTKQSDPNDVQTIDRPNAYFNFNQLTHYDYGTTYVIDVMLKRNNVWLNYYGSACTVTTPDVATLAVCGGTVATKGTFVYSEVLLYATAYRFEVTNVATSQVTPIDNGHHYFTFNEVPGFTAGAQYSVKVSVKTTGDWSAYGSACIITAPGGSGPEIPTDKVEVATSNVFKVAAYPNPYAEAFGLNITTESTAEVNVKVYDMLGKLIEIRNASVTDLKEQRIGERYAAGVYNIIVTQEANVKTLRVIKR